MLRVEESQYSHLKMLSHGYPDDRPDLTKRTDLLSLSSHLKRIRAQLTRPFEFERKDPPVYSSTNRGG